MTSPSALTSFLLGAAAANQPPADDAAAMNVRFWTRGGDPFTGPLVDAPLTYSTGGLSAENESRTRIVAMPGPQATIRGVAHWVASRAQAADGRPKWVDIATVARALVAYNREFLDIAPGAGGKLTMRRWKVGLRLTTPIEIELNADRTVKQFVSSANKLTEWAAPPHWDDRWAGLLTQPAEPLPRPNPDALATAVKAELDKPWDADAFAGRLRPRVLANPYETVFELVETMRQLRRDHAARSLPFVLHFAKGVEREQARTLGWTTAGHAALRAFWRVLAAADPSALSQEDRNRLTRALEIYAHALGLRAKEGGGWHGLLEIGPSAVPVEPPLTPAQSYVTKKDPGGSGDRNPRGAHEMVLGRSVTVGPVQTYKEKEPVTVPRWKGPAYAGEKDPRTFWTDHDDALGRDATDAQLAALDVALDIGASEGKLDACRARDRAFLSTGFQQWSIHTNTEMSVLLHRFERRAPEHYDLYFGMYGLRTVKWDRSADDVLNPPSDASIAAANKYDVPAGSPGASPYGAAFPSHVTLRAIPPGAAPAPLPATESGSGPRFEFFGGTRTEVPDPKAPNDPAKTTVVNVLSGAWTGRIRLAALTSTDYCAEQLQKAVFRFQRILDAPKPAWPAAFTQAPTLPQLFSSEFAAALLLDFHINQPGNQAALIRSALNRTLAKDTTPYEPPDSTNLSPAWLGQFAIDLMLRRPAFVKEMIKRNAHILPQHDTTLNATHGSFGGWAP